MADNTNGQGPVTVAQLQAALDKQDAKFQAALDKMQTALDARIQSALDKTQVDLNSHLASVQSAVNATISAALAEIDARASARAEKTETALLTQFHHYAVNTAARMNLFSATDASFDTRLTSLEARLLEIETRIKP